jgi:response regulator RpfG family c-di-GMP phosphodiesterase
MMPVMDGIDLIAESQKNPKMNQIPVVLVTAVSTPEVTMRAVALGVKFRLAKPWEQSELDFVFESALNLNKVS